MDEPRIPKYRAPDFMRKEIGLFYNARYQMRMLRRYGDDDAPVRDHADYSVLSHHHRPAAIPGMPEYPRTCT